MADAPLTDWLPISAVPKDGRELILRCGSRVGAAKWVSWPAVEDRELEAGEGWTVGLDGYLWEGEGAPTHFQPLPAPPTEGDHHAADPRPDDQGNAKDGRPDASAIGAARGAGADEHHEHRTGQPDRDGAHAERDCGGAGVHGACDVSAEVKATPSPPVAAPPATPVALGRYVIFTRPGKVPERKGPYPTKALMERALRDIQQAYPDANSMVLIDLPGDCWPTSGVEWIDMHGDKRKGRLITPQPQPAQPLTGAPGRDTLVLVPLKFVQGFNDLAHNYQLQAVPPDYYHGVEGDAFRNAYKRCGADLKRLRDILTAPSTPTPPAGEKS